VRYNRKLNLPHTYNAHGPPRHSDKVRTMDMDLPVTVTRLRTTAQHDLFFMVMPAMIGGFGNCFISILQASYAFLFVRAFF
jgi:hypothetical protein